MFGKKQKISDDLIDKVLTVSTKVLHTQGLDREPDLSSPLGEEGLGLSSLGIIELLLAVEKELNVSIPERYWDNRRIDTLGKLLEVVVKC